MSEVFQLTPDEAVAFAKSRKWEMVKPDVRARFQLGQEFLCLPFSTFASDVEVLLGRPVWTHELAHLDKLIAEADGKAPRPSMADILALLPADKTIVAVTECGRA